MKISVTVNRTQKNLQLKWYVVKLLTFFIGEEFLIILCSLGTKNVIKWSSILSRHMKCYCENIRQTLFCFSNHALQWVNSWHLINEKPLVFLVVFENIFPSFPSLSLWIFLDSTIYLPPPSPNYNFHYSCKGRHDPCCHIWDLNTARDCLAYWKGEGFENFDQVYSVRNMKKLQY